MFPREIVETGHNVLIRLLPRQGNREMQFGMPFVEDQYRLQEGFQQARRFAAAAARQDQDMVRIAFQRRIGAFADDLDKRVPAEMGLETGTGPDLRFEREDHDELAAVFRDARDIGLAPHPDLRADEPDNRDPELPEAFREADVESGIVDHHDDVRAFLLRQLDALEENADERADLLQHLDEPDHAELGGIHEEIHSRLAHAVTAHAAHDRAGALFHHFPRDAGAVKVAGRFAGHDPDERFFLTHNHLLQGCGIISCGVSSSAECSCSRACGSHPCRPCRRIRPCRPCRRRIRPCRACRRPSGRADCCSS